MLYYAFVVSFNFIFYGYNYWNRAEKIAVLSTLIKKTNAQEMKWIIMIILKGVKYWIFIILLDYKFKF